jgi:hypothetical protein
MTEDEKSEKEKEVSTLKYEYYNKSNELNKSKSAFQDTYGYTPIHEDISTEGDNSESGDLETECESSEPEYDNSEPGYDKRPTPRNTQPKDDPCEGPSTGTTKPKDDSDEERPHKKYKFSHDSIRDSKNFFLPILYRSFFKGFLCFLRIFLLFIYLSFPEWYFFINYLFFIDLYFISFIVTKLESAIFLHKI